MGHVVDNGVLYPEISRLAPHMIIRRSREEEQTGIMFAALMQPLMGGIV